MVEEIDSVFALGDILAFTTERDLCTGHDGVLAIMSFMLGRMPTLGEFLLAGKFTQEAILSAHPNLPDRALLDGMDADEIKTFFADCLQHYGETFRLSETLRNCIHYDARKGGLTLRWVSAAVRASMIKESKYQVENAPGTWWKKLMAERLS
jgi:hypothetical protein